jgi:hypothetical protein
MGKEFEFNSHHEKMQKKENDIKQYMTCIMWHGQLSKQYYQQLQETFQTFVTRPNNLLTNCTVCDLQMEGLSEGETTCTVEILYRACCST